MCCEMAIAAREKLKKTLSVLTREIAQQVKGRWELIFVGFFFLQIGVPHLFYCETALDFFQWFLSYLRRCLSSFPNTFSLRNSHNDIPLNSGISSAGKLFHPSVSSWRRGAICSRVCLSPPRPSIGLLLLGAQNSGLVNVTYRFIKKGC